MSTDKPFDDAPRQMTPEQLRQLDREAWQVVEDEAGRRDATTTVEGGRYVVNGQVVDANGEPIKENRR